MRKAFFEAIAGEMARDPRVTFITGDLGFGLVEPLAQRFPLQYLNAGVAEQNMTGIAAGMAMAGRIPFTYSIANFSTLRCLEQIRNDVCYHRANVKVVSVGSGLGYGALGFTHHATEDIAVMRAMPGMTVVAPGDPVETAHAVRAAVAADGPFYLRVGRGGEPIIHPHDVRFVLGRAIRVRDGADLGLLATGSQLEVAVKTADLLAAGGVRARVLSFHTIRPLDVAAVLATAEEVPALATLEEHSVDGGLGGAVAEVLAEAGLRRPPSFKRIGLVPGFAARVGDQQHLREQAGLTPEGVVAQLKPLLESRHP